MEDEKVVPTVQELASFDLNDPTIIELIHQAQESDAADRLLTIKQALKKYKKAVFWAMILSTSLVMEGYDVVVVRCISFFIRSTEYIALELTPMHRSLPSMARHNFKIDLENTTKLQGTNLSVLHGSQAFPIHLLLVNLPD